MLRVKLIGWTSTQALLASPPWNRSCASGNPGVLPSPLSASTVTLGQSLKSWCANLTSAFMKSKKSRGWGHLAGKVDSKRLEQSWRDREARVPHMKAMGKGWVHH